MSAERTRGAAGAGFRTGFEPGLVWLLARKELHDALRNRWFILYAVCFAVLSLALAAVSLTGTGTFGLAGFGRTTASLINLVLLIVPLMALTVGAGSVAGERERGTLETLLSQPVHRVEVLLGKFCGSALALLGALALGFGATALLLGLKRGTTNVASFATIFGLSVALAWTMLAVGFLISTVARRTALALGVAIFVWLGFVFIGDLGLMGGAMMLRLRVEELLGLSLINPLQVFKLAALSSLHASLDVLGPAGLYASQTFGRWLPALLGGVLALWLVIPLGLSVVVFARRPLR